VTTSVTDESDQHGGAVQHRRQLSQPRVAEMIADTLRRRILDGELNDGDVLPKVDDLLVEFPVSKPSIRESMRILETEGLISVRRGNIGGAVIHTPKAKMAAYMLGMVLQADQVQLVDLAVALSEFEPACAAEAAASSGREKLVATLVRLNRELEEKIEDGPAFTRLARRFHDAVVQGCGNATMALVAGALETLWSNHESNWAEATNAHGHYPKAPARHAVLRTHVKITEAIEDGDAVRARHLVSQHLHESQRYVLSQGKKQTITVEGLSRGTW
jgi:GntR family transcriptional regulator, transcriptional repressor for pyruvate dehydrogenase complex